MSPESVVMIEIYAIYYQEWNKLFNNLMGFFICCLNNDTRVTASNYIYLQVRYKISSMELIPIVYLSDSFGSLVGFSRQVSFFPRCVLFSVFWPLSDRHYLLWSLLWTFWSYTSLLAWHESDFSKFLYYLHLGTLQSTLYANALILSCIYTFYKRLSKIIVKKRL